MWILINVSTLQIFTKEKLIWREGAHQFDCNESWEKLEETKLPPKMYFTAS